MKLLPSEALEIFNTENVDVIFLLDYGKSQETGHVFGYTAFNHYFKKISNEDYLSTNHKSFYDSDIPVVQIERPGEEDGSIISWNVDVNRKIKQKNKEYGFITLFTDGNGNYWQKSTRGFSTALNESLASLETLIEEPDISWTDEEKEVISKALGKLNGLYK